MSHPGSVCAGNATAVAASSRYAAPPLRSGPSGDTATAVAKWLIMTMYLETLSRDALILAVLF